MAAAVALLPFLAIIRGAVAATHLGLGPWQFLGTVLSLGALLLGGLFFLYSVRYYVASLLMLVSSVLLSNGNGNGHATSNGHPHRLMRFLRRRTANGHADGNGNGNGHLDIGYEPFVSIHIATYNEKRVIGRLLEACASLDYGNYEVVVVDDSTDETATILQSWRRRPRFKVVHRATRDGFKGGALQVALRRMDPRTEFVIVWDADVVPFADSIQTYLPHFFKTNGNGGHATRPAEPRSEVAAVQSYQWHVLNKSESWLTEAVRAEYAGSYMVERPFQEAIGSLKMVAGTTYMIRAVLLRELGWGRSLTEDWELTLRLYARGYKVVYTPYAEAPAECAATFARLARQRMRWAEGHSYNVRRWFGEIVRSEHLSVTEKIEFLYYTTYYLQAGLFVAGSAAWLVAEVFLHTHVPEWTAVLGWSLLLSNLLALPLMNTAGLMLEGAPAKDFVGVLGAVATSFLLIPFQGYAALKGFFERDEGPWYRTPKTGRITDPIRHLRRLAWLRRWLFGNGRHPRHPQPSANVNAANRSMPRRSGTRWAWVAVAAMVVAVFATAVGALRAPVIESSSGSQFWLHGAVASPTFFSPTNPTITPLEIVFTNPCVPACPEVWQGADASGGPAVATSGSQTVFAGAYKFDYWSDLVSTGSNAVISWTFEYGDNAGCSINPVVIAQNSAFTLLDNHVGGTPVTVVTTGSNTTVPAGKFFCLSLAWVSGGPTHLSYNNDAGLASRPTNFTTPSVIFIPEFGVALVGLAALAPFVARVRRRDT